MKRNIKDYKTPHFITKEKPKRKGIGIGKLLIVAFFVALLLCLAVFSVYLYSPFSFRLKKVDYYMLALYSSSSIKDAESKSKSISLAGGGGYILNDGTFLVTAFVYRQKKEANTVLERLNVEYPEGKIIKYSLPASKIKRFDNRAAEKELKDLLNYPISLINELINYVYKLDSFEQTESGVMLKIEQLKEKVNNNLSASHILKDKFKNIPAINICHELYQKIQAQLSEITLLAIQEERLSSRLRSFTCYCVEQYYNHRQKL